MAFTERSKAGQQAELNNLRRERDQMVAKGLTKAAELATRAIERREAKRR